MSKTERYIQSWLLFLKHMLELNIKANSAKQVEQKLLDMSELYLRGNLSRNQHREMSEKLGAAVDAVNGTKVEIELFYNLILLFLEEVYTETRDGRKIDFIVNFMEYLNQTGYIKRLGDGEAKNGGLTFKQTEQIYESIKERLK